VRTSVGVLEDLETWGFFTTSGLAAFETLLVDLGLEVSGTYSPLAGSTKNVRPRFIVLELGHAQKQIVYLNVLLGAKSTVTTLEIAHGAEKINPAKIWPHRFCEVELAIGTLP